MPLYLRPPRAGKSPNYEIRGSYLGVRCEESTGTSRREIAEQILRKRRADIERGSVARPGEPTFADAAINYMTAGGERRFLAPLIEHFGTTALSAIDQAAIDKAAAALYPRGDATTRNRQVYTPVSAVLKRANIERKIKRPIGWRSKKTVSWLEPEQAFALFAAADARPEFGLFLRLLCYTGMRLGEALAVKVGEVDIGRSVIYLPKTKNGDARTVHLPPDLVAALANHPRGLNRTSDEKLVRYHVSGRLRTWLADAMATAGLRFPRRQGGFHLFRHTWATWMRRYGGLDTAGLVETGAWRDRSSAARYEHLNTTEEARNADLLPVPRRGMRGER
jgi:integrase